MLIDWGCPFFPVASIALLVTILAVVWSMVWKGIALWHAGRNTHLGWFIILFILPTLGILEIIYIFLFRRVMPRPRKAPLQSEITKRGDLRLQRGRIEKELQEVRDKAKRK